MLSLISLFLYRLGTPCLGNSATHRGPCLPMSINEDNLPQNRPPGQPSVDSLCVSLQVIQGVVKLTIRANHGVGARAAGRNCLVADQHYRQAAVFVLPRRPMVLMLDYLIRSSLINIKKCSVADIFPTQRQEKRRLSPQNLFLPVYFLLLLRPDARALGVSL